MRTKKLFELLLVKLTRVYTRCTKGGYNSTFKSKTIRIYKYTWTWMLLSFWLGLVSPNLKDHRYHQSTFIWWKVWSARVKLKTPDCNFFLKIYILCSIHTIKRRKWYGIHIPKQKFSKPSLIHITMMRKKFLLEPDVYIKQVGYPILKWEKEPYCMKKNVWGNPLTYPTPRKITEIKEKLEMLMECLKLKGICVLLLIVWIKGCSIETYNPCLIDFHVQNLE